MIRYALKCDKEHKFDSWFQSSEGYDSLRNAGHISCAVCGSTEVERDLMAPRIAKKSSQKPELKAPDHDVTKAVEALRKQVEENSEYVGVQFAKEARKIHDGDAPERAIYGEAKPEEAKALIEDGVPIAPLPFTPKRKTN